MSSAFNSGEADEVDQPEMSVDQILSKFSIVKSARGFNRFNKDEMLRIADLIGIQDGNWDERMDFLYEWLQQQREELQKSDGPQVVNQASADVSVPTNVNAEAVAKALFNPLLERILQELKPRVSDDDDELNEFTKNARSQVTSNAVQTVNTRVPASDNRVQTQISDLGVIAMADRIGMLSRTVEELHRNNLYAEKFPVIELSEKRSTDEYEILMLALRHMKASTEYSMSPIAKDHIQTASTMLVKRALALKLADTDGWSAAKHFMDNSPNSFDNDYPELVKQMKEEAKIDRKRKVLQGAIEKNVKKGKVAAAVPEVAQELAQPKVANKVVPHGRNFQGSSESKKGACYKCHQYGHFARFCPTRNRNEQQGNN